MKQTNIAVIDLETDPFAPRRFPQPFSACFYDGQSCEIYWGEDCLKRLSKRIANFPGYVYAHNGGRFDLHFLLPYLPSNDYIKLINGRIAQLRFGLAELRDSLLILPVALSAFKKDEIDYRIFEADQREKPDNKKKIIHYLKNDCIYLREIIVKFFDKFGFALTLANRGFNQLEKFGYKAPHASKYHDALFRPFYFGGRVDMFETGLLAPDKAQGENQFLFLDINSAYPYAMKFPHWFDLEYTEWPGLPKNESQLKCSLVDFTAYSDGALPLRNERTKSVFFPQGEYRFKATGWEIFSGLKTGRIRIKKVHAAFIPKSTTDFSKFVDHFYQEKLNAEKAGDKTERQFNKLILNAAYGRFALDIEKFKDYSLETKIPTETRLLELAKENFQLLKEWDDTENDLSVWQRPSKSKGNCFNVCTACSITGFVRAYLFEAINAVARPIYCDTDSLVCASSGTLPLGENLGDWKLEATGQTMAVAGKKLYAFGYSDPEKPNDPFKYKIASKGARLTAAEIIRIAKGEIIEWESESPNYSMTRNNSFIKRKIRLTDSTK